MFISYKVEHSLKVAFDFDMKKLSEGLECYSHI